MHTKYSGFTVLDGTLCLHLEECSEDQSRVKSATLLPSATQAKSVTADAVELDHRVALSKRERERERERGGGGEERYFEVQKKNCSVTIPIIVGQTRQYRRCTGISHEKKKKQEV